MIELLAYSQVDLIFAFSAATAARICQAIKSAELRSGTNFSYFLYFQFRVNKYEKHSEEHQTFLTGLIKHRFRRKLHVCKACLPETPL